MAFPVPPGVSAADRDPTADLQEAARRVARSFASLSRCEDEFGTADPFACSEWRDALDEAIADLAGEVRVCIECGRDHPDRTPTCASCVALREEAILAVAHLYEPSPAAEPNVHLRQNADYLKGLTDDPS